MLMDSYVLSSPLVTAVIGIIIILVGKWLFVTLKRIRSLPSGPWGYPIVGYLPRIKDHLYLEFDRLSGKYGPVFSIKLGHENIVVVCDWPHMKDAFANDALLARPDAVFFPGISDFPSFVEMSGDIWREHRRLSLHLLRDVGLGKSVLENLVGEEIQSFLKTLDNGGKPIDLPKKLTPSVSNNISILLFGHKFEYDDPVKMDLDNNIDTLGREFSFAGIFVFLPWLARLFIYLGKFKIGLIRDSVLSVESYIQKEIELHKKKKSNEVTDYIYGYLKERERRKNNINDKANGPEIFGYDYLRRNCFAFFGAGLETISSTMIWAMLYLLKYPKYQTIIQSEIHQVIGNERNPEYSDRGRMPFTMAFLYEVHRHSSVIATNLFRRASRDTTIGTFNIPKGTFVLFNFWSVHYDPKLWNDPHKFDPYRFLTEEGTKVVKPAYLVPFSGGKRICPGEGLANVESFLYLVSIFQKFKIKPESGAQLTYESTFGVSRRPTKMPKIIFERIN